LRDASWPANSAGDRTAFTGVVGTVLDDYVFIAGTPDQPDRELLVLSTEAAQVSPDQRVKASGQILCFRHAEFSGPYRLLESQPFRPFENRRFLLASEVRGDPQW
jgi:hypothetical protein